jgi:transcriptional regulator with XRE-family HTH domain
MREADLYTAQECLVKFSPHWSDCSVLAGWPPLLNRRAFGETLRILRTARGWSLEDLAYETRRAAAGDEDKSFSVGYLGQLERGIRRPTIAVMVAVSGPLEVDPRETFPEMRLEEARRQLDERELGMDQALANLDLVEEQLLGAGVSESVEESPRVPGPPEGSQLAKLLQDASPTQQDPRPSTTPRPARRRKRA